MSQEALIGEEILNAVLRNWTRIIEEEAQSLRRAQQTYPGEVVQRRA
jgi:hypothetical protein